MSVFKKTKSKKAKSTKKPKSKVTKFKVKKSLNQSTLIAGAKSNPGMIRATTNLPSTKLLDVTLLCFKSLFCDFVLLVDVWCGLV